MQSKLISLVAGDDYTIPFIIYVPGTTTADDISGWTLTFAVKTHAGVDDTRSILNLPAVIQNATAGSVLVSLSSVDTSRARGVNWWVLRGIDTLGKHHTCAQGIWIAQLS